MDVARPAAFGAAGDRSGPAVAMAAIHEVDRCVHCGLCLNQCPTYRITRMETESPRGRIHLVRSMAEGRLAPSGSVADHLYLCLGCRACETACPSGVEYGRIAESARDALGPPGGLFSRAVLRLVLRHLMPHPNRLRLAARLVHFGQRTGLSAALSRLLPPSLRRGVEMLPRVSPRPQGAPVEVLPALGERRARVAFLSGCAMDLFFPEINEATVRLLRQRGCEVHVPRGQACCGALNMHNGELESARGMARRNIDAFPEDVDAVVTNAAGCGAAMREYGHLLAGDPVYQARAERFSARVRDATELLFAMSAGGEDLHAGATRITGPPATDGEPVAVTYSDPCHLAHGQGVRAEPRALLQTIPGVTIKEMDPPDRCCGSAGIYNLLQPEMADEILREKMDAILATGAAIVVAPNPGCMIQLRYGATRFGVPVAVRHLMDMLDEVHR